MGLQLISPVLFESVSNVTSTNSVELGSRRRDADGYEYIYCYNAGNSQLSPGFGCIVVSGTSGYSVTITSVAGGAHDFVGVVKHATVATAKYGWILYKGFSKLEAPADSTVTGANYLVLKADGTFGTLSATTGKMEPIVAMSDLDVDTASAGSFLGKVFSPMF